MDNQILFSFEPSGASAVTAGQDGLTTAGVPASEKLAEHDRPKIRPRKPRFESAATTFDLPAALLAGIASRESRGGAVLDAQGFGDNGNAFGIMQVDKRFHDLQGTDDPGSQEHVDQATQILSDFFKKVQTKHPDWPTERQLQGAVAAYNSGVGNVQTLAGMDKGTTGNDYSNDVWARARHYATHWNYL